MIPPALWLIALPIGAAPIVYLFRRVGVGAVVAALVAFFSAWLAIRLPSGLALNFLGRSIEFDSLSQLMLSILFVTTAGLFLISSVSVPFIAGMRTKVVEADVLRGAGRTFYPISLAILGLLVAASLSRHLGITAIFIEAAAILAVLIIQGSRLESTRAAQRFLVLMSLATPFFLVVAWRVDQFQLMGVSQPAGVLQQTAVLVGVGFAFWLAIVPFHGWLSATAAEASPASATFILVAFPVVAFLTLIHLVADVPWLANASQLFWALSVAGVATACVGGLLTAVQRGLSGLMGYTALYDLGCIVAVLGIGGQAAIITVLVSLVVRSLALTLIAASISAIRLQISGDGFAQMRGLGRRMPLATVGLVVGGLTLAGAPLTIGFAVRWQLLQVIAAVDPHWSVFLTLAGLGVAVGYLRGLFALLPHPAPDTQKVQWQRKRTSTLHEPSLLVVIITFLSVDCIALGLFPAVLIQPLQTLAAGIFVPI